MISILAITGPTRSSRQKKNKNYFLRQKLEKADDALVSVHQPALCLSTENPDRPVPKSSASPPLPPFLKEIIKLEKYSASLIK